MKIIMKLLKPTETFATLYTVQLPNMKGTCAKTARAP